jgi:hypothetical protein
MVVAHVLLFAAGAAIVVATLLSAVRSFVVPRGESMRIGRVVFVTTRDLFRLRLRWTTDFERRDQTMALYAPVSLLMLPLAWLALVIGGYTAMFWSLGGRSLRHAFELSGSSTFTLGFALAHDLPSVALVFTEAALGIGLLALVIAYLPTMYAAFQRRELLVTLLEVRAGRPPTAQAMIRRFHLIHGLGELEDMWERWEQWFADVEESHTSLPALVFFRSPQPDKSWVTAAGAVLDAASIAASTLDVGPTPSAELCVRAGYLALRRIAGVFAIPFDHDPKPTDPISIRRGEYDALYESLAGIGVPLLADRDQAWRDFAGWRVNYDSVLLELAALTSAPTAPWSSDRAPPFRRVRITNWARRRAGDRLSG